VIDRRKLCLAVVLLALVLQGCGKPPPEKAARNLRGSARPVRITMMALHMSGGVPPRWRFTPPPGDVAEGRKTFEELGCHSCHTVKGEPFSIATDTGPDLSGMGTHHPPEYFVESIMNPDAVLVEGKGWIDSAGRSSMPIYPDLTVVQIADLVAYLSSLTQGGRHYVPPEARPVTTMGSPWAPPSLPEAPPSEAKSYWVQSYDVKDDMLEPFVEWWKSEGAKQFMAYEGVVGLDTWVNLTREGPSMVSILGFRDEAARERFLSDPATEALGNKFDEFIGPHPHRSYDRPPLYKVPSLSAP
jgi:mono/diheme cytochrome c family protein